ncbi:MAG: phage tail tape measure protein [Pseudopelagicola sp.]|nr:phage tail tape measure protein [Pseudopelagicola sp.]
MSAGNLNIALVLKLVDEVTKPLRKVTGALGKVGELSDKTGRAGVAWSNRQIEANRARQAAMQGEILGLAAMGAGLVALTEPAVQAEARMAEISKVVEFKDANGLKLLQRDIRDLVTSGGLAATADGVADIVAAAGRMGVVDANLPDAAKRAQLLEFAQAASKMSVAFGISAEEAGTSLARWRQNLGLSQEQAMALGDTVNLLGNTMATNEADILQVINRQGVVAKTAGLAANEIAALSATFLAAGASPEIAATGLKNFTNVMVKGESMTKRQSAVIDALGIDAVELAKRMQVDATGGILSVLDAFQKIEPHRRNSMVGDLFGEEAKGAIMPLIANTDLLRETFERTADTAALLGLMEAEYQRQAETTLAQRRRLMEFVKGLSVTIGSVLLPVLNDLMSALMPLISQMTEWAEAHPELIRIVFVLAGGLLLLKGAALVAGFAFTTLAGPILRVIWAGSWLLRIVPGIGRVLLWVTKGPMRLAWAGLGLLTKGVKALGLAFMKLPVVVIFAAIAALAYAIYDNWDQIVAYVTEKIDAVKSAFDEGLLNGVFKLLAEFNPFTLAIDGMQGLVAYVMDLLGVPEKIVSAFAEFSLFDTGVALLLSLWDGMASLVPQMVAAISAKLSAIVPDWMKSAWNWVAGDSEEAAAGPSVEGKRDGGGPVRPGFLYRINERGQEFFQPGTSGTVLPARALKVATAAAAMTSISAPLLADAVPMLRHLDRRPALSMPTSAPQVTRQGDTITINIAPSPGVRAEDIAREVERVLAQREDEKRADLHDGVDY